MPWSSAGLDVVLLGAVEESLDVLGEVVLEELLLGEVGELLGSAIATWLIPSPRPRRLTDAAAMSAGFFMVIPFMSAVCQNDARLTTPPVAELSTA
jgi:hypothetical protein